MNDPRLRRHPLGYLEVAEPPTSDELTKYYARTYYQSERGNYRHTYPPQELLVKLLRIEQRAAQALALRNSKESGCLLDVGCGEGFVLAAFRSMGWEVSGIDFSVAGVQGSNPQVAESVEQGDVFALLERRIAAGDLYDLVWLGNVLEHVLDPVTLLRSLQRLVSDDGVLVVTVPNDGNPYHERLLADGLITSRWWVAIPDHISYFTAESLQSIAQETGWECASILADFPIDIFLAHPGSNYVEDPGLGPDAHKARLRLEELIGKAGSDAANRLYAALADVGLGRNITGFLRRQSSSLT